jgi:hypothetical protein
MPTIRENALKENTPPTAARLGWGSIGIGIPPLFPYGVNHRANFRVAGWHRFQRQPSASAQLQMFRYNHKPWSRSNKFGFNGKGLIWSNVVT